MGLFKKIRTWLKVPTHFSAEDFAERERFRPDYELLARTLVDELDFETFVDVGCANGFLLEALLAAGKEGSGLEISEDAREVLPPALQSRVQIGDFSELLGSHDLVCCVEVAEHIEPHRTDDLVRALTGAARGTIYFTAAPPGQGGHGHINCRPREDWISRFASRGWPEDVDATRRIQSRLEALETAPWLRTNTIVLRAAAVRSSTEHMRVGRRPA